jgi:hypothetical protein
MFMAHSSQISLLPELRAAGFSLRGQADFSNVSLHSIIRAG